MSTELFPFDLPSLQETYERMANIKKEVEEWLSQLNVKWAQKLLNYHIQHPDLLFHSSTVKIQLNTITKEKCHGTHGQFHWKHRTDIDTHIKTVDEYLEEHLKVFPYEMDSQINKLLVEYESHQDYLESHGLEYQNTIFEIDNYSARVKFNYSSFFYDLTLDMEYSKNLSF